MPYYPAPMICIGCGRFAHDERKLVGMNANEGTPPIQARWCKDPRCWTVLSELSKYSTDAEKVAQVNEQRKALCAEAETVYYPFTTPKAWLKLVVPRPQPAAR